MPPGQINPSVQPVSQESNQHPKRPRGWLRWLIVAQVVLALIGIGAWILAAKHSPAQPHANHSLSPKSSATGSSTQAASATQGLQLDPNKDYGNKYADGILPVGDNKFSTTTPQIGYIYACSSYAQSLSSSAGGAQARGPWFTDNNTAYNINQKSVVEGSVSWASEAEFTDTLSGDTRIITSNDLPSSGTTGIFPISPSDPAYQYDRNPNHISSQSFTYDLNANPIYGAPQCMGGESGVMLTGVALFNGFDAGGRDAGAWEVQDSCQGHPDEADVYHYHTLSSCIKDISVHTVLGFALDGFPITGPEVGPSNYLTTSDLDVCHGLTSAIDIDGKSVTMYHYVMTEDFPYSVSCFRSSPIQPPNQNQANPGQLAPPPR